MRLIIIPCLLLLSYITLAQSNDSTKIDTKPQTKKSISDKTGDEEQIEMIIMTQPNYKGGISKLRRDLNKKVNLNKSINGNVYIQFTVDKKGRAYGFKSIKGFSKEVDNKLISVLKELQNWTPAVSQSEKTDCVYMIKVKIVKGKVQQ